MTGLHVVRARDRAAALAALRLGLGLVGALAARLVVRGDQVALGLALGALGFAVIGTARQLELGRAPVEDGLPGAAVVLGPVGPALAGLYPSSLGVLAFTLVAIPLEPLLAPLLAGILVGMSIATFAGVGQLASAERLRRCRLYVTVAPPLRAFAAPVGEPRSVDGPHA